MLLTPWQQRTITAVQWNAEKAEPLQLSDNNTQSKGWDIHIPGFCRVHWTLNSGTKGLIPTGWLIEFA
jgi:hypothetical protein